MDAGAGPGGAGGGGGGGGGDGGPRAARVVLLDWGLAKTLNTKMRLSFARMAYGAATLDFGEMLQAFDDMGIVLKRFDPEEDMKNIRYVKKVKRWY